jgi:hypothetical protein
MLARVAEFHFCRDRIDWSQNPEALHCGKVPAAHLTEVVTLANAAVRNDSLDPVEAAVRLGRVAARAAPSARRSCRASSYDDRPAVSRP